MSNRASDSLTPSNRHLTTKELAIVGAHAFVGWALCAAIMGIGPLFLSMDATLIAHAIGAPIKDSTSALL